MLLTIWCNAQLTDKATEQLISATQEHRLVFGERVSNLSRAVPDPRVEEAEVVFGQPDPEQMIALENVRWMHITSAGYTRYDRDDLLSALRSRGAAFTNSSSVYNEPCAQHVLAFMLAHARQLPASLADQLGSRAWVYGDLRPQTRVLRGETVLLLGFGAIAQRLVQLLEPFGMRIVAVRQSVRGDESVETVPVSSLEAVIGSADYIVDTLPARASTEGLLSRQFLDLIKPSALFYNIGRGTTVDQDALVAALNSGRLAAAYLDVTEPEPLPADHPLWSARNCFITPHIGGGFAREYEGLVEHFLGNVRRYVEGERLVDRIV
ncbi:MAG TPA: D-2-hydroxyacid dehydrogenase [Fimbriimonas sp.]|nr:D-2-hydroxyacid dehydrogenase [Fimbriimonas sp.]